MAELEDDSESEAGWNVLRSAAMSDTTPTAPTETDPNATDNAAGAADNFADGSQLARCTLIDASYRRK